MTKSAAATKSVKSTKPAVKASAKPAAPVKGAKASAKPAAAVKEVTPKVKAVKAPKVHVETKADKARALYTSMNGQARKDVVKAFQDQIGLSGAAAATYYQNIRKASGAPAAVVAKA